MTDIWFYHLERQPLETVLPRILAAMCARGDRISVHATTKAVLDDVSKKLWAMEDVAFISHSFATDPYAERQNLLLCLDQQSPNQSKQRIFIDDAVPEHTGGAERVSIFFDGTSETAITSARDLWKRFRAEGHGIKYWKQSDVGRWEDQAVSKAA